MFAPWFNRLARQLGVPEGKHRRRPAKSKVSVPVKPVVETLEERTVPTVLFFDDFSTSTNGWKLDTEWQIGSATASSGGTSGFFQDPAVDHTPTADNGVAGVVIGGFASTNVHPYEYFTSPVINANVTGQVKMSFWRFLNSDYSPYMQSDIEVFNGTAWTTVYANGTSSVTDSAWNLQTIDLTPFKNANLQVRFGITVGSAGVFTVSSWNIDDFQVFAPNDPFAGADPLSGASATAAGSNVGFTGEVGEPNPFADATIQSAWWKWTAPTDGMASVDTFGSNFDTTLGVYTGTAVNALTTIGTNDDSGGSQSKVTFAAFKGTTYYFAVDGKAAATGNIAINLNQTPNVAPSNVVVTPPASFSEGTLGTLKIAFTDSNALDTHTVDIDWDGDSKFDQTVALAAGVTSASIDHTYADDNPTGTPSDSTTITVKITDPFAANATGTGKATVNNVAPSAVVITPNLTSFNEGDVITLGGSFADPGTLTPTRW